MPEESNRILAMPVTYFLSAFNLIFALESDFLGYTYILVCERVVRLGFLAIVVEGVRVAVEER